MHIIHTGRVTFEWSGDDCIAKAGQVVWVPAGMSVARETGHKMVDRTTLHLRSGTWAPANPADSEAIKLVQTIDRVAYRLGPRLPCTPTTRNSLVELLVKMEGLWQDPAAPHHRCGLKAGAIEVLSLLVADRRLQQADVSPELPPARRAAERIEPAVYHLNQRNFITRPDLSVEDLSRLCGYRPARFHALFLEVTGVTPQRYLTERRIAYACDLLRRPEASIISVAFEAGFNSQSRFYQAFRAVMGMPPGQWRRQHQTEVRD